MKACSSLKIDIVVNIFFNCDQVPTITNLKSYSISNFCPLCFINVKTVTNATSHITRGVCRTLAQGQYLYKNTPRSN